MPAKVKIPAGDKITISHGKLPVPDHPIIAFIGDLRLRAAHGGRDGGQVLRVRHRHHREHGGPVMTAPGGARPMERTWDSGGRGRAIARVPAPGER